MVAEDLMPSSDRVVEGGHGSNKITSGQENLRRAISEVRLLESRMAETTPGVKQQAWQEGDSLRSLVVISAPG